MNARRPLGGASAGEDALGRAREAACPVEPGSPRTQPRPPAAARPTQHRPQCPLDRRNSLVRTGASVLGYFLGEESKTPRDLRVTGCGRAGTDREQPPREAAAPGRKSTIRSKPTVYGPAHPESCVNPLNLCSMTRCEEQFINLKNIFVAFLKLKQIKVKGFG